MSGLRKAAEQALKALDRLSEDGICQTSRHAKTDQHTLLEVCPVFLRFRVAATDLRAALAAPQQAEPEIVQRVKSYAGQTMRTARSPNITARECIDLANWIVALNAPQQAEPQQGEPGKEEA